MNYVLLYHTSYELSEYSRFKQIGHKQKIRMSFDCTYFDLLALIRCCLNFSGGGVFATFLHLVTLLI